MTKNQKGNKMEDHAYRPYVRDDNRKRRSNSYGKLNSFAWSKTEEFQYVEFLKNNKDHFYNVQERKKSKIFVAMSNYLKKRGPDQCRSHHQKMSLKYGSIDAIIQKITETKLAVITERSQQPNFSTQLKQVQSQYNSLVEISMQEDEKVDNQSQNLEMIEIQMDAPKQEAILWDYLNDNVWVNL